MADAIKIPRKELLESLKAINKYVEVELLLLRNRDNLIPEKEPKDMNAKEVIVAKALMANEFDEDGLHTIYTASEMLQNWGKYQ